MNFLKALSKSETIDFLSRPAPMLEKGGDIMGMDKVNVHVGEINKLAGLISALTDNESRWKTGKDVDTCRSVLDCVSTLSFALHTRAMNTYDLMAESASPSFEERVFGAKGKMEAPPDCVDEEMEAPPDCDRQTKAKETAINQALCLAREVRAMSNDLIAELVSSNRG